MPAKKKVLILTNRLVIGGMAIEVIPLVYYLQKDFDIDILYGEKESDEKEIFYLLKFYPGLSLKKIPYLSKRMRMLNEIKVYRFISKEIKDKQYQIVHTHGSKTGFVGRIAASRAGVPCIVHTFHGHLFHSYFNSLVSRFLVRTEKWLAGFTNHIIATSQQQKEDLADIYKIAPSEKISVINLGVDLSIFFKDFNPEDKSFRLRYGLTEDTVAIGIVARIVPVKNFELFIDVAGRVVNSVNKPVKFFVIGDGVMKTHVQQKLSENKITWCNSDQFDKNAAVIFTSWIENIVPALNSMDIVMLTSNNEGTALALVEAQLCGVPVVACNVGGVRDTFIDNETGFLVQKDNPEAFSKKLKILIEDKSLRQDMGKMASGFAIEKFSKEAEVEKIKQLYNSCA